MRILGSWLLPAFGVSVLVPFGFVHSLAAYGAFPRTGVPNRVVRTICVHHLFIQRMSGHPRGCGESPMQPVPGLGRALICRLRSQNWLGFTAPNIPSCPEIAVLQFQAEIASLREAGGGGGHERRSKASGASVQYVTTHQRGLRNRHSVRNVFSLHTCVDAAKYLKDR